MEVPDPNGFNLGPLQALPMEHPHNLATAGRTAANPTLPKNNVNQISTKLPPIGSVLEGRHLHNPRPLQRVELLEWVHRLECEALALTRLDRMVRVLVLQGPPSVTQQAQAAPA